MEISLNLLCIGSSCKIAIQEANDPSNAALVHMSCNLKDSLSFVRCNFEKSSGDQ